MDYILTLPFLIILSPILIIISIIIRIFLGKPVIFKQIRPGYKGSKFTIMKFRSMRDVCDESGNLLSDEKRMTKLGKFLRSYSLDEFPELFNVLKGDMSLVGPRPLLVEYLDRYTTEQARRHDVLPGITGWAQVNGRNALTWEDKFALDVWYVDHWSLGLDIKILFMTLWKVIKKEGISHPGNATMDKFMGTKKPSK
jgi:lipopolysaccharide/colanic/teichoic acid biosynthesis glycosyltransferase